MPDLDIHKIIGEMKTDIKWIKEALEDYDKRFSNKWVETIMKGIVGTVLFTVIGALMSLVIMSGGVAVAYTLIN